MQDYYSEAIMDIYQMVADRLEHFDSMHRDLQTVILAAMDADEDMERKLRRIFEALEDAKKQPARIRD